MFIQTESLRRLSKGDDFFPNITEKVKELPKFKPISDEQMLRVSEILHETKNPRKSRLIEAASDTDTNLDRQDEKRCSQGGTCEFFFYCWMIGGLLDGSCGSLLKGCCHRVAKAGILGVQDSNSIEYSSNEGQSYGPVINDESKLLRGFV